MTQRLSPSWIEQAKANVRADVQSIVATGNLLKPTEWPYPPAPYRPPPYHVPPSIRTEAIEAKMARNASICSAYQNGDRLKVIAARHGVSIPTVFKIVKASGLPLRNGGRGQT